jgi:ribonuclease HII
MPWIIGIDEAGYGPNLGPFVMTSVACRLPHDPAETDLWKLLRPVVRRPREREDGRLLVEDSKVVYSTTRGLKALERGVLAVLGPHVSGKLDTVLAPTLAGWLDALAPADHIDLREECWYAGDTPLPVAAHPEDLRHTADRFRQACLEVDLAWASARSVIVCPSRFNGLLERWGSKSIVLMVSLAELLQANLQPGPEPEPVFVFVDKHGGRNHYADVLQQAIPQGRVVVGEEGQAQSCYQIEGLDRPYYLRFQPRAESQCFCVALASMLAKYVRELLMAEFNCFWRQHLPELKPTAGYPGDAARYMEAIRPVAKRLGIAETALWRHK